MIVAPISVAVATVARPCRRSSSAASTVAGYDVGRQWARLVAYASTAANDLIATIVGEDGVVDIMVFVVRRVILV